MASAFRARPQGRVSRGRLLIFVSLGTEHFPFERALDLVETIEGDEDVLVQHGQTPARAQLPRFRWVDALDYDELVSCMRTASAVICHGGVGTVMTALRAGNAPVVVPRLRRFGEAVDDHQVEIAAELAGRGLVVSCLPGEDVGSALAQSARLRPSLAHAGSELRRAVALATR